MNITSLNDTSSTSEIVMALDLARIIVSNYGSRGISMVGIFVNLFGLLVLRNKHLEEKFYDCLFCRCFCNLVVCLFGSFHHRPSCMMCPNNFLFEVYQRSFYYPWSRIALMASIICDILLILNRLVMLFNKRNNVFFTLSKKVNISIVQCTSYPTHRF